MAPEAVPTADPRGAEAVAVGMLETDSASPKRRRGLIVGSLVLSGLGIVGTTVGTVFNVKGANDKERLQDASLGSEATFDELYNDTLPKDQAMTIVGYSVGGTLIAVGLGLALAHKLRKRPREQLGKRRATLSAGADGTIRLAF
jgi:hypothetical protein